MICLAYLSTATRPMSQDEVDGIVAHSQRANTANDITGLLCHNDGSFLQFLEGPEAAILSTFDRIKRDPRHFSILEVYRKPLERRAFEGWSMASVQPGKASPELQAFTHNLRQVEIAADAEHKAALDGFLNVFRAWLR